MGENPEIFVSLSLQQAGYMYDYAILVGEGTPKNAEIMKTAIEKTYGESKAKKMFSLADYYEKEGIEKGIEEGIEKGIEKGIQTVERLLSKGVLDEAQAKKAIKAMQQDLKK